MLIEKFDSAKLIDFYSGNDLEIDFKEFTKVKHENPQMSQFELLNYFFDEVIIKMQDSSFRVGNRK